MSNHLQLLRQPGLPLWLQVAQGEVVQVLGAEGLGRVLSKKKQYNFERQHSSLNLLSHLILSCPLPSPPVSGPEAPRDVLAAPPAATVVLTVV